MPLPLIQPAPLHAPINPVLQHFIDNLVHLALAGQQAVGEDSAEDSGSAIEISAATSADQDSS